ncbi:NB-ARC domain-containing protein [Nonomuraea sp. NPDC049400]|uniref:NB-ARC domain-containing protein n=1 Tax=Nonomuraea sp. NPDC049400 TaxID=3364352 RepID=UPI00378A9051
MDYPDASKFRVEGRDESVDFEILLEDGTPVLFAQAKTRMEPGQWSATEILKLARTWADADPSGNAALKFLSDAPLSNSGQTLRQLIKLARTSSDSASWWTEAQSIASASLGLKEEDYPIIARLEVSTRLGPWQQMLDQIKVEMLRLTDRPLDVHTIDNMTNSLFVKLFEKTSEDDTESRLIDVAQLEELFASSLHERVSNERHARVRTTTSIRGLVPETKAFGRQEELGQIRGTFGDPNAASRLLYAICGLGGIGKSTLAQQYVTRFQSNYDLIWWVGADSRPRILAAYRELAEENGLQGDLDERALLHWLSQEIRRYSGRVLVVYDNIDDIEDIRSLLPQAPGHIIVTSRNSAMLGRVDGLSLGSMSVGDALTWFETSFPGRETVELEGLIEALDGIPLALAQAYSYIRATGCSIQDYLSALHLYRLRILNDEETVPLSYERNKTIAATVVMSLDAFIQQFENQKAMQSDPVHVASQILVRCSLLGPRQIPLSLATLGLSSDSPLFEGIREARKYSLIDLDDGFLRMHRVVQDVVRSVSTEESIEVLLGAFEHVLVEELANALERREWSFASLMLGHALSVAGNVIGFGKPSINTSALLSNAANVVAALYGDFELAERMLRDGLKVLDKFSSPQLPYRRASTAGTLAQILYNLRRHEEAQSYARQAIACLEGVENLNAMEADSLIRAYVIEMNASYALDSIAACVTAMRQLDRILEREDASESARLHAMADKVQILIWRRDWPSADLCLTGLEESVRRELVADVDLQRHVACMRAIVEIWMGRLEDGIQIQLGIQSSWSTSPLLIQRQHADDLIEIAHGLAIQCVRRWQSQSGAYDWPLEAATHILDSARTILIGSVDPPRESLGALELRMANVELARYQIWGQAENLDNAISTLRRSINIYGSASSILSEAARQLLSILETAQRESLDLSAMLQEPPPTSMLSPRFELPVEFHQTTPMPDLEWVEIFASRERIKPEIREIAVGALILQYHLSGQSGFSEVMAYACLAEAYRSLGYTVHVIPVCVHFLSADMSSLGVPDNCAHSSNHPHQTPLITHSVLWVSELARVVDPAPMLLRARIGDSLSDTLLRAPVILPGLSYGDICSASPLFSRDKYFIGYRFHTEHESFTREAIHAHWTEQWQSFARVLAADIRSMLNAFSS